MTQSTNSTPAWKEFEELAASIQKELSPQAKVSHNVRLEGKRSRTERQIDILVEQDVSPYSIRIVVDCKDHKDPVDVKDVEMFIGLVEDVGANKGAMVAASGFTPAAKTRAKDAGVDVYRLVDTKSTKWSAYVTIPCVMREAFIESFSFTFRSIGQCRIANCDFRLMTLYRAGNTPIDCLHNLLLDKWDAGNIPSALGSYENVPLVDGDSFIKTNGSFYKITVLANAVVRERVYFGQLPLAEVKGFADEVTGDFHTRGFTTAPLNPYIIEKTWKRIESVQQLAVQPVILLAIKSSPDRIRQSLNI